MSTSITFDDIEEEEDDSKTVLVDAFVSPFGWIPAERVSHDAVKFMDDTHTVHPCLRMAPLHSRSLRDEFSEARQGQGVLVFDEYEPSSPSQWCRAVVESVDGEDDIIVRTDRGSTLRVTRDCIRPFFSQPISIHPQTNLPRRDDSNYDRIRPEEIVLKYHESLLDQGLRAVAMRGDGNCLFRAASHQVYGTEEHHLLVRKSCAEYMSIEKAYFEPFVAEASGKTTGRSPYSGFDQYVRETMREGVWGDDPELQAICELYQRPSEIYCWDRSAKKAIILRRLNDEAVSNFFSDAQPMRFSFLGGGHYDSIVPINTPTAMKNKPSTLVMKQSPPPKPGFLEARALDIARSRCAGGVTLAAKLSDELETERAQIEEALMRSRQISAERRAKGFNLQEALAQSLQSIAEEESNAMEKVRLQSIRDAEDAELARVLQESMIDGERNRPKERMSVSEPISLHDDDDELLRLAIEESLRF